FFFSSRRRHTRSDRDWSSDVCSSDLQLLPPTRRPWLSQNRPCHSTSPAEWLRSARQTGSLQGLREDKSYYGTSGPSIAGSGGESRPAAQRSRQPGVTRPERSHPARSSVKCDAPRSKIVLRAYPRECSPPGSKGLPRTPS